MARLPFLLTIVHGGTVLPRELTTRLALTPADVFYDSDPWTREIFSFGETVQGRLEAEVARSVIDIDCDPSLKPPKVKDGVVRLVTRYNKPVWREDGEPTLEDVNRLVDRYHRNYHDILDRVASRGGVRLGIDCHSMAPYGAPLRLRRGAGVPARLTARRYQRLKPLPSSCRSSNEPIHTTLRARMVLSSI